MDDDAAPKQRRGFALQSQERRIEIAREGGRAAHRKGTAHSFDSDEAARAGQIGGRSVSRDREHMARIGQRGGIRRAEKARLLQEMQKRPIPSG